MECRFTSLILVLLIVVEGLRHFIFEALAADVWLFKDPRTQLAIRVLEQRISALCTPLEAIVDEACVARADRGLAPLLAHSMAVAVLCSTEIGTAATWLALSCYWILGMVLGALAAVLADKGRPADTSTGFLVAARRPFPVAEALRGTHHQLVREELLVEVCRTCEATFKAKSVAPAPCQRVSRELEDNCARIIRGEPLHQRLNGVRFCSGRANLTSLLRDKRSPISRRHNPEGPLH